MRIVKKIVLFLAAAAMAVSAMAANPRVSILGDSYSSFKGWITPESNYEWYPAQGWDPAKTNDVANVEEMWWHILLNRQGWELEINNSSSGMPVCNIGYDRTPCPGTSFVARMYNLGNPDIIFVFGGTNDSRAGIPMGELCYGLPSREQLDTFAPAFCYMIHGLKHLYPRATIYNITGDDFSPRQVALMDEACRHYDIVNIQLHDIDKVDMHPTVKGMRQIVDQITRAIASSAVPAAPEQP